MRRLFLAALAFACAAAPASAAVAIVTGQSVSGNTTTASTSCPTNTTSAPTVGNEDFIVVDSADSPTTPTGWTATVAQSSSGFSTTVFSRVAQSGDPSTVTVTLTGSAECVWSWSEFSGESTTHPVYAGTFATTSTASANTPNASERAFAASGLDLITYSGYNTTAVATSATDNPPSGITTTQLAFVSHLANGGNYAVLSTFYTTTDPFVAAQPYSSFGTFNASQTKLAANVVWIPPAGYTPPVSTGCFPYAYPCVFRPA
jgi:hypothetical protein